MDAFVTLAISFGLLAMVMFGLVIITFLMLVGLAFSLVVEGVPRRARIASSVVSPRVVPVLFPRRRRSDWEQAA